MSEENKKIKLNLGTVSLAEELSSYYIDMRPAIIHYTENIWGGKFDENGVPLCGSIDGLMYSPVNIAQYGFMLHAEWLETKSENTLITLKNCIEVLETLKLEKNGSFVWYHHHYEAKYKIDSPWASAMAQGEVISFYLRMYQILKSDYLLETAIKAYEFLKFDYKDGGVRRIDENGYLWFEEYPSNPPSYVLNGFIYTIFGLFDLYRVTQNSDVKKDIDLCVETLKCNLHKFDAGYWSYYDLLKKELVRYYYQKNVHVPQLEVLYILTKEPIFDKYKCKWEKTVNPFNYLFVQIMYRVKYRFSLLVKIGQG